MKQWIAHVTIVVKEYDEAIEFYTQKLDFQLIEDTYIPEQDKRWVLISPPGSKGSQILLAKASSPSQLAAIGNQTGGRVGFFLYTDDFYRDYEKYKARGIKFIRPVAVPPYGTVSVFEDLYGNLWDLLEPTAKP